MAILSNRTRPIAINTNRFAPMSSGSNRKAAAVINNPALAHTHSMLAQAARVPRLANISSVSKLLSAHAGRAKPKK